MCNIGQIESKGFVYAGYYMRKENAPGHFVKLQPGEKVLLCRYYKSYIPRFVILCIKARRHFWPDRRNGAEKGRREPAAACANCKLGRSITKRVHTRPGCLCINSSIAKCRNHGLNNR